MHLQANGQRHCMSGQKPKLNGRKPIVSGRKTKLNGRKLTVSGRKTNHQVQRCSLKKCLYVNVKKEDCPKGQSSKKFSFSICHVIPLVRYHHDDSNQLQLQNRNVLIRRILLQNRQQKQLSLLRYHEVLRLQQCLR